MGRPSGVRLRPPTLDPGPWGEVRVQRPLGNRRSRTTQGQLPKASPPAPGGPALGNREHPGPSCQHGTVRRRRQASALPPQHQPPCHCHCHCPRKRVLSGEEGAQVLPWCPLQPLGTGEHKRTHDADPGTQQKVEGRLPQPRAWNRDPHPRWRHTPPPCSRQPGEDARAQASGRRPWEPGGGGSCPPGEAPGQRPVPAGSSEEVLNQRRHHLHPQLHLPARLLKGGGGHHPRPQVELLLLLGKRNKQESGVSSGPGGHAGCKTCLGKVEKPVCVNSEDRDVRGTGHTEPKRCSRWWRLHTPSPTNEAVPLTVLRPLLNETRSVSSHAGKKRDVRNHPPASWPRPRKGTGLSDTADEGGAGDIWGETRQQAAKVSKRISCKNFSQLTKH